MTTGIELIAIERQEQIEKHGWDLTRDKDYSKGELLQAAKFCITLEYDDWPWNGSPIGDRFRQKISLKTSEDRAITAGAFCAAELDRINEVEPTFFDFLKPIIDHPAKSKMISVKRYESLLFGEMTKWEPVYSYVNTNNENYEPYQILGYKPVVNIPRREAE